MAKKKVLDCTLRDGGYINNWNFGREIIKDIIYKLVISRVDYIEIGFLRDCNYCSDVTLFNNISEAKNILPEVHGSTKFVLMALHNQYDISKLEKCDNKSIEMIRVTFHDYDVDEGLEFCAKVIEKGYKCFCNPINIMGYSDEKFLILLEKINKLNPYGFSIVDTFGSMMKHDLMRVYSLVEHNLNKNIIVGLHLHENLSLSYSLAQEFMQICLNDRNTIIDGSLLGMGRVPGNLCIELLMDYMNRCYTKNYYLDSMLDAIDEYILPIKEKTPWGYSIEYALSAKNNVHRNYAEYLINKEKLCARDINTLLSQIENGKKSAFDKEYIEKLYQEYLDVKVDDKENLKYIQKKLIDRKTLILAPGKSINENYEKIIKYIDENNAFVIAANFNDYRFSINSIFFSNLRRYEKYLDKKNTDEIWITSNLIKANLRKEKYIFNFYDLAFDGTTINDNSVIMLLKLLCKIGIKDVVIAGMDGYTDKNDYVRNYYNNKRKNLKEIEEHNSLLEASIAQLRKNMNIQFITESMYDRRNHE